MEVVFRSESQRRRFDILAQREMTLSIYLDGLALTTLRLRDNVMYLLNQVGWDNVSVRKRYSQYHRLTLDFLSSPYYDPNKGIGFGRGLTTFRLFGT